MYISQSSFKTVSDVLSTYGNGKITKTNIVSELCTPVLSAFLMNGFIMDSDDKANEALSASVLKSLQLDSPI